MKNETITECNKNRTDLFRYRWIAVICKSRYFPLVPQILTIIFLTVMLYDGFTGTQSQLENFAIVGPWFLFMPVTIIFTLILFGRIWCAICPIGAIEVACGRVGQSRWFPNRFKRPALFLSLGSFIFIIWVFYRDLGIRTIPFNSALFFTVWVVIAIAVGLMFRGRPFCRYLCPITLPLNLYSRVSPFELKSDSAICRTCKTRECLNGNQNVEGCPMSLYPAFMDGISNCIYCMKCVKSCPNGSMRLYTRPFGRELLKINKDGVFESITSLSLVGIFPLMMTYMTIRGTLTDSPLDAISQVFASILSIPVNRGIIHISSTILWVTMAILLFALASLITKNVLNIRFKQAFSIFGPPFIILPLVGNLGHLILHNILSNFGVPLMYLSSLIGIYFYHAPNIIDMNIIGILSIVNSYLNFAIAFLLTALAVYLIARKVNKKKALTATLPYLVLLIIFLFFVYNQRFAQLGLPYL